VGIAEVVREAYPDPTAEEGDWSCVDIVPFKPVKKPVTLAALKSHASLQDLALIRQTRLSVMPISAPEFKTILKMGS